MERKDSAKRAEHILKRAGEIEGKISTAHAALEAKRAEAMERIAARRNEAVRRLNGGERERVRRDVSVRTESTRRRAEEVREAIEGEDKKLRRLKLSNPVLSTRGKRVKRVVAPEAPLQETS